MLTVSRPAVDSASTARQAPRRSWLRVPEARWAAVAVGLFAIGGILQMAGGPAALWWAAYLACYLAGGWEPALAGLQALRDKTLDVDLLMVLAALLAASIGQVFDGALLIVIFATSGALEAIATRRTRESVTALLDLAPEKASRIEDDGAETAVEAMELRVGDVIRIRPGERIGADGTVIGGSSDVDQSTITGESLPAVKQPGAEVYAGTMNGAGTLLVRVGRRAEESVVARIVRMVEEASQTKAKTQLFIENIEQKYSLVMVATTLVLFFLPLAMGAPLEPTLLRAITFMIVASPCAVVLATMPPLLSAIANAGRHGVLVKSAVVMEQVGLGDTVAFDKTGTLTRGTPEVTSVDLLPGSRFTRDEVLRLAGAAELPSQHPLGVAIVAAARREHRLPSPGDFISKPGRGIEAVVEGLRVQVVSPRDSSVPTVGSDRLSRLVATREAEGTSVVLVVVDSRPEALVSLADRIRPNAERAVRELTELTGHPPVLLSGDNTAAARRLAGRVGIGDVRAELLPQHKVDAVRRLESSGRRVVLIGDGVNDAPAMAAAHLGIAMGRQGSDLALETADAVIVHDDLTAVSRVIALSRRARRVVVANLILAATVILALVAWDLVGTLPLPIAVAGHEGSTVLVGLNGLRLLRSSAWEDVQPHSNRSSRTTTAASRAVSTFRSRRR